MLSIYAYLSYLLAKYFILYYILMPLVNCHQSTAALLSGTLRTFQVHACDGEELKLECVANTVISIYLAQYGHSMPAQQLCPQLPSTSPSVSPLAVNSEHQSSSSHNSTSNSLFNYNNGSSDCLASETLRYSLLQTVEFTCREQRICKFMTSPQSFGAIDPCPGVRKYAEVAFKCRPNTFYNKVICGGDRLRLKCPNSLRIVIYSASFGSTRDYVPECPAMSQSEPILQSLANTEECQVSYATEIVMSSCHARRKCSLDADIDTFGDPGCSKSTRLRLKVVYACVPKEILKDIDVAVNSNNNNNDKSNSDKIAGNVEDNANDYTGFVEEPRYIPELDLSSTSHPSGHIKQSNNNKIVMKEDLSIVPARDTYFQSDYKNVHIILNNNSIDSDSDVNCTLIAPPEKIIGFISDWISAVHFIKKNTERLILYLLVSLCGSLVCFLVVLSSRLYMQKRRAIKKIKEDLPTLQPFGSLNEDNSDDLLDQLDGVTTVTQPLNHSHGHQHHHHHAIEVVRYSNPNGNNTIGPASRSTSIRRQNSDTNPRAMARNLNNFYYT